MDGSGNQIGLSKDCSIDSYVTFVYRTTGGSWASLPGDGSRPADMATTELTDGRTVDFIVRQERGTINRFIYSFATLASLGDEADDATAENWNGRVLFHFEGGVAIGHTQGRISGRALELEVLKKGYAVIYSTGTRTNAHYNLQVGGETALMVKEHFRLVGLNATDAYPDPFAGAKTMLGYSTAPGMTECIPAWRGLTPLVMNPLFGNARNQEQMQPAGVMNSVEWTHYDDLRNIYGVDENGNPRTLFDNAGVQYGLGALRDGNISKSEFMKLNAQVGGWKQPSEMVQEGFPFVGSLADVQADRSKFDPWSFRNMNLSPDGTAPAPRTKGDLIAIQAAYTSGMVFDGQLNMPVIDWRHYLEEVLDMHNSHQSFSVRQRITNKMGDAGNQVIWFTDTRPTDTTDPEEPEPREESNPTWAALDVLHDWLMNIRANPELSIADNKPAAAVDTCYETDGTVIAAGAGVWNGILGAQPEGACTARFETYTTSRMVAGGPIEGSVFKCSLKPVATAQTDSTYGTIAFTEGEVTRLNEIFPDGVCDYSQPDQGRPEE